MPEFRVQDFHDPLLEKQQLILLIALNFLINHEVLLYEHQWQEVKFQTVTILNYWLIDASKDSVSLSTMKIKR